MRLPDLPLAISQQGGISLTFKEMNITLTLIYLVAMRWLGVNLVRVVIQENFPLMFPKTPKLPLLEYLESRWIYLKPSEFMTKHLAKVYCFSKSVSPSPAL